MNLKINDKVWAITFDKTEVPKTRAVTDFGAWNLFRTQRPALSSHSIKELERLGFSARKDKKK